jgi:acetolactate synthase-1/2/3 large subunit
MGKSQKTGAEQLAAFLKKRQVDHVFGIPGSQDLDLYEAVDRASIRVILAAHEQGAGFMAIGWARARRSPGVLFVIAGPGFTNALTTLAEAHFDEVPLLCLLVKSQTITGRRFQFQRIDERTMAQQFLKRVVSIESTEDLLVRMEEAFRAAQDGIPGPVLVEIALPILTQKSVPPVSSFHPPSEPISDAKDFPLGDIGKRILSAQRPVVYLGRGTEAAAGGILSFVERLECPVLVTPAARGILPENHAFYIGGDLVRNDVSDVNALLDRSDLVLALGCRFTQACTGGYRLRLPRDRLVLIESELGFEPEGRDIISIPVKVDRFIRFLQKSGLLSGWTHSWKAQELAEWRKRLMTVTRSRFLEPGFKGLKPGTARTFFQILRGEMPDSFRMVTDSGLHQLMARRWHEARTPASFLFPQEYQSMGFGLPVSIGAALAEPERPTMAVIGDGGFAMTGMELGTAVRENISLMVTVFNDGHLGIIRLAQIKRWGRSVATRTPPLDLAGFARAAGAKYHKVDHDLTKILARCREGGVHLIEVLLRDNLDIYRAKARGKLKTRHFF